MADMEGRFKLSSPDPFAMCSQEVDWSLLNREAQDSDVSQDDLTDYDHAAHQVANAQEWAAIDLMLPELVKSPKPDSGGRQVVELPPEAIGNLISMRTDESQIEGEA